MLAQGLAALGSGLSCSRGPAGFVGTMALSCPKCTKLHGPDANLCQARGTGMAQSLPCSRCAQPTLRGAAFCSKCGCATPCVVEVKDEPAAAQVKHEPLTTDGPPGVGATHKPQAAQAKSEPLIAKVKNEPSSVAVQKEHLPMLPSAGDSAIRGNQSPSSYKVMPARTAPYKNDALVVVPEGLVSNADVLAALKTISWPENKRKIMRNGGPYFGFTTGLVRNYFTQAPCSSDQRLAGSRLMHLVGKWVLVAALIVSTKCDRLVRSSHMFS